MSKANQRKWESLGKAVQKVADLWDAVDYEELAEEYASSSFERYLDKIDFALIVDSDSMRVEIEHPQYESKGVYFAYLFKYLCNKQIEVAPKEREFVASELRRIADEIDEARTANRGFPFSAPDERNGRTPSKKAMEKRLEDLVRSLKKDMQSK